jgi:hypothetical protein
MKVVAFDPGITTGYAMGDINEVGKMLIATGQQKWTQKGLFDNLEWFKPDRIVYESFEFRRKSRDNLELFSRELIGVIELYADVNKVPTHVQSPSQVMMYFTDSRLKKDGAYKPGKPHANDAVRHLLYWFQFGPGYKWNQEGYEVGARR